MVDLTSQTWHDQGMSSRQLISTAEGSRTEAFGSSEWGLLAFAGITWGASFLFIAEGLEAFTPAQIGFIRVVFAFVTFALVRKARDTKIDREDWPRVALLGVCWMAFPFWLFPLAEQRVSSGLAGMLNGAVPLFAAGIAALLLRRLPGRKQMMGLGVGLVGLILIGLPAFEGGGSSTIGVLLILVALMSYGLSINVSVPLTQKYGALPVLWRAQFVALLISAPGAAVGLQTSHFEWGAFFAMVALGVGGTALAYVAMTTLAARVGSTRASVTIYISPPVALLLGYQFRDEPIQVLSVIGTVIVLGGAWLTSRSE